MAEDVARTLARLRTIAGHLHAAVGLVEAGRTLEAVAQLMAVQAALRAVRGQVGRRHARRCLPTQPGGQTVNEILAWLRAEMILRRRGRSVPFFSRN